MNATGIDAPSHTSTREPTAAAPSLGTQTFGSSEAAVTPLRLLHVEDNPADAMLMQEYIRGILPDVEFDTATRLSDVTFDRLHGAHCAIVDLSLPDATGLDALITLRRMTEMLPIIVLTGFEDLEVGLAALRYGADDYLVKNHADGYTLERAVRYAVERRRLALDLAREAAAASIVAAGARKAEAARGAEILHQVESGGDLHARSPSHAAPGTHQVAVRIDADTGDYTLVCESCDWQAERGDDHLHSWRDRQLDWVLMRHVAFGDLPDAAEALPTPGSREAGVVPSDEEEVAEEEASTREPVPRRVMLSPGRWLHPRSDDDDDDDGDELAAAADDWPR